MLWAGYYRPDVQCITCQYGSYYCPGENARYACGNTLVTRFTNPTSYSQCLCPQSGSYFTGSSCSLCVLPYYCPDLWNRFMCPLPIQASAMLSASTPTTPVYCACAGGTYGPGCIPCPSGYYCRESTTMRWNYARLFDVITTAPLTSTSALSDAIHGALLAYYTAPGNTDLVYGTDTLEYAYVYIYNSSHALTTSVTFHAMVMVQQTREAVGWVDAVTMYQAYASRTGGVVSSVASNNAYVLDRNMLNVAQPAQCPGGQVPNSAATDCMCRAGSYLSSRVLSSLVCSQCPQGTFKPSANTDSECTVCTGNSTNADVGATACDVPLVQSAAHRVVSSPLLVVLLIALLI